MKTQPLSMALVMEDGFGIHIRTTARANDPWVIANVEPLMDSHQAAREWQCCLRKFRMPRHCHEWNERQPDSRNSPHQH